MFDPQGEGDPASGKQRDKESRPALPLSYSGKAVTLPRLTTNPDTYPRGGVVGIELALSRQPDTRRLRAGTLADRVQLGPASLPCFPAV